MGSRNTARADRIREEIDISQVLIDYGYYVHSGAEHQFSCDLHGDGMDNSPSARVYPVSASWYCWGCETTRDAIQTVREKEGIGFVEALRLLEQRYHLPRLPWEDEHDDRPREEPNPFDTTFGRAHTYEEERRFALSFLKDITPSWSDNSEGKVRRGRIPDDQDIPEEMLLGFWEAFDMIEYKVRKGWEEAKGAKAMASLQAKVLQRSREHHAV